MPQQKWNSWNHGFLNQITFLWLLSGFCDSVFNSNPESIVTGALNAVIDKWNVCRDIIGCCHIIELNMCKSKKVPVVDW